MAKSIKIKCTSSRAVNIQENNLYSARIDDEGNVSMMVYNSAELKKKRVYLSVGISGELFIAGVGGVVVATFIELKTKTLKCVGLDHKNPVKKILHRRQALPGGKRSCAGRRRRIHLRP